MRAVVVLGLAALLLGRGLAVAQEPGAAQDPPLDPPTTIGAWREALELDLPAEVLGPGPAAVAPGAPLAREGEALALVARALFDAGREAQAAALLDGAEPRAETAVFVELERAREALERDELGAALERLAVEGDPTRPRWPACAQAWLLIGRALVRLGRLAEGVPPLERYVELEPLGEGAYAALHMLSQAALRAGDGTRAQELVQRAVEVGQWRAYYRVRRLQVRESPDEPLPRLGVAQLLMQARQLDRALRVLEELTERCPTYAPGWHHLGELARARQDWAAAKAAYAKALTLDPELALARYNRAVILLREGSAAQAREDLETIVAGPMAEDPRLVAAHLALARLLAASGESEAAQARYARYLELGGSEPLAP